MIVNPDKKNIVIIMLMMTHKKYVDDVDEIIIVFLFMHLYICIYLYIY